MRSIGLSTGWMLLEAVADGMLAEPVSIYALNAPEYAGMYLSNTAGKPKKRGPSFLNGYQ